MYRLDGVDEEVKSYFAPVAKLVLSSRDPQEAMVVRTLQHQQPSCRMQTFQGPAAGAAPHPGPLAWVCSVRLEAWRHATLGAPLTALPRRARRPWPPCRRRWRRSAASRRCPSRAAC
jgi:hypothetical protein